MIQRVDFDQLLAYAAGKRVIAISGFGGAGKSTTAKRLGDATGSAVVSVDDFIFDRLANRSDDWGDLDRARLIEQVLKPARVGAEIRFQRYDWPTNSMAEWISISAGTRLIVEGIGIIHPDLEPYFDLKVWVDVPLEVAGERGKYRDREIYKVQHDELWDAVWIPNDRDYFAKHRPDQRADLLLAPN